MIEIHAIARLIEHLEFMQKRPVMYFGKYDPDIAEHFLYGFSLAASAMLNRDHGADLNLKEKVLKERGWKLSAERLHRQMVKRKMSSQEVVEELITIELYYWKQIETEMSQKNRPA
jgi:hypothetical protein